MAPCRLCNDQEKGDSGDVRLAFDFTPDELVQSASAESCASCAVILAGIIRAETDTWSFRDDVRRVYARFRSITNTKSDTLSLETYFKDERPKLELELFSLGSDCKFDKTLE